MLNEISAEFVPVRFGGDEFYIIMPGSPLEEAREFAQRVQRDMHPRMEEAGFNVTSSIGIASLRVEDKTGEDLFIKADEALLLAKEKGKNRVEVFEPKA